MWLFLPEAAGDGCSSGVGLEAAGVGETAVVVADLGQDAGGQLRAQAREGQQDLCVGMLGEELLDSLGEFLGGLAGGVELAQEGEHLLAEGVLDELQLVRVLGAEDLAQAVSLRVELAALSDFLEALDVLRSSQLIAPQDQRFAFVVLGVHGEGVIGHVAAIEDGFSGHGRRNHETSASR